MSEEISYANALARDLANQKERLIKDALSRVLGRNDWKLEEVIDKLHSFVTIGKEETITLGNKPIIVFYPFNTDIEEKDGSVFLKGHFNYKFLV